MSNPDILSSPIEYLKGVGPAKGDLLKKEIGVFRFQDLLEYFPYRHIDRTRISLVRDIGLQTEFIQLTGKLMSLEILGVKRGRRLVAELKDSSGIIELVWFQGINWIQKNLETGKDYLVFGRTGIFQGMPQITHPEMELVSLSNRETKNFLEPVYSTTEKLRARGLSGKQIGKLTYTLLRLLHEKDIPENLPQDIINSLELYPRFQAYTQIHFPSDLQLYARALYRLKFEELFLAQVRLGLIKSGRHRYSKGIVFGKVGELFNQFYKENLPFELTGAQKRVFKEIRSDTAHGRQMNRLLQGDTGSGKTIIALLCMLLAADNGYQSCLMAPTEILAQQHFNSISGLMKNMGLQIALLTGSTKKSAKNKILLALQNAELDFLIGTHALIEDNVKFKNLGLAIVDEQHRFGVAQRAKLWKKASLLPHVLVMTATPIPRTLAMTAYGDLDYSVIDELPPGRRPVKTVHRLDDSRAAVMDFIKEQIKKGRQAYIIFPLIEESEKMDYENLMRGYENVKAFFPEPAYWISMLHGRQAPAVKKTNMERFVRGDTQIMVSTTVIEVGVDVANASVMVIENAEKFGLSQLHQLRGRVGRGADESFCILLTSSRPTSEAKERIMVMCATNDGFVIAEKDLDLRGPGEIEGTRQSGELNFKLANLLQDKQLLQTAREMAERIVAEDPLLNAPSNQSLKQFLQSQTGKRSWSQIS
jgi:ATP-dependent DNA helicase RecG